MPLVTPNLDQRTFEQIVAEARRRIPTLTPEWTDLNEGDPGITLTQLFAFMTEHLLFQVNQVPTKGLVTFLKMVGVDLHPASPAVTDVTFTPKPGLGQYFSLAAGTQVQTSGPPPGQREPLTFETTRTLEALNGNLVDVVSRDCTLAYVSHKTANESPIQTYRPFGKATSTQEFFYLVFELNDLTDICPNDATKPCWPMGKFQLRINVGGSSDVGDPPELEYESEAPKRIQWSFASGMTTGFDETVSLAFIDFEPTLDSSLEFTRSGYLEFAFDQNTRQSFARAPADVEPEFFKQYFVLRARLARDDAYQGLAIPTLNTIRLNTVPARAVRSVLAEVLGGSSGLAFQRFRLANAPVVVGSTQIVVNEPSASGADRVPWREVDDLFAAGPEDRVYQLFPATGDILFGNGVFGKIPPADDGIAVKETAGGGNIAAMKYQFGGGLAGNMGKGTLTNLVLGSTTGLPGFDVTNVLAAAGGADEEPVDQGLVRAPAVVRSRYRAVTAEDFEALARETPDVRVDRAYALASTRPKVGIGQSPGAVTVLLVPHAEFASSIEAPIELQSHVSAAVLRYLDQRRLIATEVYTAAPRFRKLTVRAKLVAEPRASAHDTRLASVQELQRYFHALVGGVDGLGWPFGGTIFFSRVFEQLLNVSGVARAEQVSLSLDDGDFVDCTDITIGPGELLYSGHHLIVVQGA